jgi:uncharacterized protein (TIGR03118 family)
MLRAKRRPSAFSRTRLHVEALEGRCLLSGGLDVLQTNLVSDLPGVAEHLDPNLVNPWGISESPTIPGTPPKPGSPFWVSDNNAGVSTLYNTAGDPLKLVVSIPTPGSPLTSTGTPTGTVFNIDFGGGGFKVMGFDKNGNPVSAPAIFLFATEDGTIVGWNGLNPEKTVAKPGTYGIIAVDNSTIPSAADGAVYKGMTMATDANGHTHLYVTNFRAGTVEIYNPDFSLAGTFTDPKLTAKGFAPFNVETFNGKLYVTFAKQNADKHDDVAGHGLGFVDVFNLDGTPGLAGGESRLISRGQLNAPWGLAIAPSTFGGLAGALLVGNFGDGRIHAYDATTGDFIGTLTDPDGEAIAIDGLWALKVGNGGNGGDAGTVYFTAGLFGETHGLFGSLQSVAPGTPEGDSEAQFAQGALDVAQTNLNTVVQDIINNVSPTQFQQDLQALVISLNTLAHVEHNLDVDIHHDHASPGSLAVTVDAAIDQFFAELGDL